MIKSGCQMARAALKKVARRRAKQFGEIGRIPVSQTIPLTLDKELKMKKFLLTLLLMFSIGHAVAAKEVVADAVVLQENGKDASDFKRSLTLASNMHKILTKAKFEIVVYGPNVKLLTAFSDELPLIQKVQSEGIKVIACGLTLQTDNINPKELAPGIQVVPSGGVWIVNRQKQGWQYIKSSS